MKFIKIPKAKKQSGFIDSIGEEFLLYTEQSKKEEQQRLQDLLETIYIPRLFGGFLKMRHGRIVR